MPKNGFVKTCTASFKKLFSTRNIIVVSDHKVGHYPVSGAVQIGFALLVIGFFSFVSYMSGSYMAAQSVLAEKDRKIMAASVEKRRMGEDFALLKRDIVKLRDNGKELNEYSSFILDQYAATGKKDGLKPSLLSSLAAAKADGDMTQGITADSNVMSRIVYLEKRIEEIKTENDQLVGAIRERTDDRIDLFEDIIETTGLKMSALEKKMEDKNKPKEAKSTKKPSAFNNQGGPLVPYDSTSFSREQKMLLDNVGRLMVLHEIVTTLPLSKPIKNGKFMSGFGVRIDPFTKRHAVHEGIDLAAPSGAKIYSVNDGTVTFAGRKGAYGMMVEVEHGLGITTRYGHMSQIHVSLGDKIKKDHVVGIQGSTGRSTGDHVHYEVRFNNIPLNPQKFLKAGEHVLD